MKRFLKFTFILFWLVSCAETPRISNLMYYHDASGQERRVKNIDDWQLKCVEIRDSMQAIFGPFPSLENLPPLNVCYLDSLATPEYTRYTIRFTAAEGEEVPAYLYLPAGRVTGKKYPAMIALHPTSPIGKRVMDGDTKPDRAYPDCAYGKELAQRGYVVIAPDYPGFGELSDYDFKYDRYLSGSMAGIFYHIRCVDMLEQLSCTDKERIGVIGHSLGGHNAMYVAAFEPRLKLIVSSCGWTELEYYGVGPAPDREEFCGAGRNWPQAQEVYAPLFRDKYNFNDDAIPFRFHEVIGLLAPRPFFSHSPVNDYNFNVEGVRVGIRKAMEAYRFFDAENSLQVLYSEVGHNFGEDRWTVYEWIDSVFCFSRENLRPRLREQASPPASGEKFHLYLLIGQSNMAGRGIVEPQDTAGNPRILRLNRAGDWEIAKDPLHFDLRPSVGVGPGLAFAREMLPAAGDDAVIGLVPCAVGGSSIDVWQAGSFFEIRKCYPYDDMLLRIKLAMKDGTLKGILWLQGENDAPQPDGYKEKFLRFVSTLRNDLHAGDVPFLAGELAPFVTDPKYAAGYAAITRAFHEAKTDLSAYDVVSSSGARLMADGVHFDAASAREFGRRYAEKMKILQETKTNSSDK